MKVQHFYYTPDGGFIFDDQESLTPDLVFYFFHSQIPDPHNVYDLMRQHFPQGDLIGSSAAGPIMENIIYDEAITGAAIQFAHDNVYKLFEVSCISQEDSYRAGREIVENLLAPDLRHIFVVTDGITVNGDELARGINALLPSEVALSGGLASNNFSFDETRTGINRPPVSGNINAIGFYSDAISVTTAAGGGWSAFGIERKVTHSDGTKLYTLDDKPALDIYKEYLGPDAEGLPGTGLLFPLSIRYEGGSDGFVRTVNNVDYETGALHFTGEIPEGTYAQFMKSNLENLAEGAATCAEDATSGLNGKNSQLAIAISCIGRLLLMGEKAVEELKSVKHVLSSTPVIGFYSNGELSYSEEYGALLHNETMTITLFHEKDPE